MTTFGVELEFLLLHPIRESAPLDLVISALSEPFPCKCVMPDCSEIHHHITLPLHGEAYMNDDYSKWDVTTDLTVTLPQELRDYLPTNYSRTSVELVSRVFNFHGTTPLPDGSHGPTWQTELSSVLEMLHRNLKRAGAFAIVNASAGLHVHLGSNPRIPDKVTRGVLSVFTAMERQLDSILPTSRISGYPDPLALNPFPRHNQWVYRKYAYPRETLVSYKPAYVMQNGSLWCKPLSSLHICGVVVNRRQEASDPSSTHHIAPSRFALDVPAWLSHIMEPDIDLFSLYSVGQDGHNTSVNIDNTVNLNGTIEIRCHSGTLDFNEISAWVDLMCNMFEFCGRVSQSSLITNLLNAWQTPEYTLIDLAQYLGASQQTCDFYKLVLSDGYAEQRSINAIAMHEIEESHDLSPIIMATEMKRHESSFRPHVVEKIRHKFESGLYGTHTKAVVQHMIKEHKMSDSALTLVLSDAEQLECSTAAQKWALEHDDTAADDETDK